ncbi:LysR family transcriptional regulator [Vibrio splendidus]|nr:LysR family transcriptional regulator [Vibrio splendidus]
MNRLRQMSVFAHIVEEGSVSRAADKLDLSKSVVSQHLKALEKELDVCLLKRTTRRQNLTEMGERFYIKCKDLNLIAESAWDLAQDFQLDPQGRIRITAPHALMDSLVAPVVAELMQKYPRLKPELISDDRHLDFMEHDIDLAVRVGRSKDSNLKQKRLGSFRDVLCGTRDMKLKDIQDQAYIGNSWQGKRISHEFSNPAGESFVFAKEVNCSTNSFHSCLSMIRSGAGIGVIPDFYLTQLIPDVINLIPDMDLPMNTIYALNPFLTNTPIAVTHCIAALQAKLNLVDS